MPMKSQRQKTPEGYLIVPSPIARTGIYEYDGSEIGLEEGKTYTVARYPEDVFDPVSMASFENKPITREHPEDMEVNAETWTELSKGVLRNHYRENDKLMAVCVVQDADTIRDVEKGIVELSAGYDLDLVPDDRGNADFKQINIRGNHVAIVPSGRAGSEVRLGDCKFQPKGTKPMNVLDKLFAKIGIKATDAQKIAVKKGLKLNDAELPESDPRYKYVDPNSPDYDPEYDPNNADDPRNAPANDSDVADIVVNPEPVPPAPPESNKGTTDKPADKAVDTDKPATDSDDVADLKEQLAAALAKIAEMQSANDSDEEAKDEAVKVANDALKIVPAMRVFLSDSAETIKRRALVTAGVCDLKSIKSLDSKELDHAFLSLKLDGSNKKLGAGLMANDGNQKQNINQLYRSKK